MRSVGDAQVRVGVDASDGDVGDTHIRDAVEAEGHVLQSDDLLERRAAREGGEETEGEKSGPHRPNLTTPG